MKANDNTKIKKVPFSVIPQRIKMQGLYRIDIFWTHLLDALQGYKKNYNLELTPAFQRGHVWSKDQQIKYIEFILGGGITGKDIYFNYPGWGNDWEPDLQMVCVDGLQRLTAATEFMRNKFQVFGKYYAENFIRLDMRCGFKLHINDLKTEKDILQWYVEMNAGGTPHSNAEIQKVRQMINQADKSGYRECPEPHHPE